MSYSPWIALLTFILSVVGFLMIHLHLGRRKFYRTNAAGLQEFPSYSNFVLTRLYEGALGLVSILLFVAIWVALFMVLHAPRRSW